MINLGEKIKNLREERDLKQKDLAEILNISVSNISKYESSDMVPSLEVFKKIAEYFDVSADYLIGLTARKKSNDFDRFNELLRGLPEEDIDILEIFIKYLWFKNLQKWENEDDF